MGMAQRQWTVTQIGAREHYAVPRALARAGRLRRFYTDAWCPTWRSLLRRGPAALRALAGRYHPDLARAEVVGFTLASVIDQLKHRGRGAGTAEEIGAEYLRVGRWFARHVNAHLERQPLDPQRDAVFAFNTGALETLEMLNARGIPSVLDQIDPGKVEAELVLQEARKWPGWDAAGTPMLPENYYRHLAAEWQAATWVLVNSDWSREALVRQGVPAEKIVVVPLAYDAEAAAGRVREKSSGRLTVLWLGNVILRKGIQYLMDAARQVEAMDFVVAGPLGITPEAVAKAPKNLRFVGRVTRDQAGELYRQADLFVLPTVSDGFAITQLEAMAHGLPVIVTPNCARVVSDGREGLVVPACDAAALAGALERMDRERTLLPEMSRQAMLRVRDFSLAHYAACLERL